MINGGLWDINRYGKFLTFAFGTPLAVIVSFLGAEGPKYYSSNLEKLCHLLREKLRDSPHTQGKIHTTL